MGGARASGEITSDVDTNAIILICFIIYLCRFVTLSFLEINVFLFFVVSTDWFVVITVICCLFVDLLQGLKQIFVHIIIIINDNTNYYY